MEDAKAVRIEIEHEAQKIEQLEKENAEMHVESAAEVESILALKFAEPLHVVLARVKENAKNMSVNEALKHVQKVTPELKSLLAEKHGKAAFRQEPVTPQEKP